MRPGRELDRRLASGEQFLRDAGIASASLEAELLLARAMSLTRARLLSAPDAPSADQVRLYQEFLERRRRRVPLQYILGETEFYSRRFLCRAGVAIPKPSTETLVEEALALPFKTACDVGCGSGVISVTLGLERPEARLVAADLSPDALRLTSDNAARHGVRPWLVRSDLLSPFRCRFDLIVSNPPYIADDEWPQVDPEVHAEPRLALAAGPQGLDVIRRLILQSLRSLAPNGGLLMEVGFRQARAVAKLLEESGFRDVRVVEDFDGIERIVGGHR